MRAVLLVHASPGRDDGPGLRIETAEPEFESQRWSECAADLVFVGHTHIPADSTVSGLRMINVGSVSVPPEPRGATWSLINFDSSGYSIEKHETGYDLNAVRAALRAADHPTPDWLARKLHLTNARRHIGSGDHEP